MKEQMVIAQTNDNYDYYYTEDYKWDLLDNGWLRIEKLSGNVWKQYYSPTRVRYFYFHLVD